MAAQLPATSLSYKIAVLVFLENSAGELLLILRNKAPNLGSWSPIGGKLEMGLGESPFECAARETLEETGHAISTADLHLFCMIAEEAYEGAGHWLMFLFRCRKPIDTLPPTIDEGRFGFFSRSTFGTLPIPDTDRTAPWPIWVKFLPRFGTLRAFCAPDQALRIEVEQITPAPTTS